MNTSSRFASLAVCAVIASSMSLGGCVVDGTVETDESADFDTSEEVAEESSALTETQLSNSIWLNGIWPLPSIVNERGRYVKDAYDGGNGSACWSHEKGQYSFGFVTGASRGWAIFNSTGCQTTNRIAILLSQTHLGVSPCEDLPTTFTCTQPKVGSLVPLYSYPTEFNASGQKVTSTTWSRILSAKQANPTVPVRVIINPCNGPDVTKCGMTSANLTDYNNEISKIVNAGVVVLGYIATNYAENDLEHPDIEAEVKANVDKYVSSYPNVRGFFFDEMTSGYEPGDYEVPLDFYRRMHDYAKSKALGSTNREYTVVGNPGRDTRSGYIYVVDTFVMFEDDLSIRPVAIAGSNNWHNRWDRGNFALLGYNISYINSNFLATARPHVGFTFLTNDSGYNPWDTVPEYFSSLLSGLN